MIRPLRTLPILLAVLAALVVAVPAQAAAPGVVAHKVPAPGSPDEAALIAQVKLSGAQHVRFYVSWAVMEPAPGQLGYLAALDSLVGKLRAIGVKVNFVVTETPAWAGGGDRIAPPPPAAYADFLRRLAAHFRGKVSAYEVWNEPDAESFWRGGPNPVAYAALLKAAYAAGKQGDPGAQIGIGGLTGNNYGFVDQLYVQGAKGSFDFASVHTDNGCNLQDPREAYRDPNTGQVGRFSFTGYRELRQLMLDHGDDKPIRMTELGWSVSTKKCGSQPAGVTLANQAAFLTRAYACLAADPYVDEATWFSLGDFGAAEEPGFRFGLMDFNGAHRPAFAAFQKAASVAPDASCGLTVDRSGPQGGAAYPVQGANVSGYLGFRFEAKDDKALHGIAMYVDGKLITSTGTSVLQGIWGGWLRLPSGPHTVKFRATDSAGNETVQEFLVNKVGFGDGEAIPTNLSLGVYGTGATRLAVARIFTKPALASKSLGGKIFVRFERKTATGWASMGRARATVVSKMARVSRKLKPGLYRAIVEFPGFKSFKPSAKRRYFIVR
jgi:hypothetical protein